MSKTSEPFVSGQPRDALGTHKSIVPGCHPDDVTQLLISTHIRRKLITETPESDYRRYDRRRTSLFHFAVKSLLRADNARRSGSHLLARMHGILAFLALKAGVMYSKFSKLFL